jgi:hypothetical protein
MIVVHNPFWPQDEALYVMGLSAKEWDNLLLHERHRWNTMTHEALRRRLRKIQRASKLLAFFTGCLCCWSSSDCEYELYGYAISRAREIGFNSLADRAAIEAGFGPAVSALAAPVRPDIRLIRFGQQSVAIEGKR